MTELSQPIISGTPSQTQPLWRFNYRFQPDSGLIRPSPGGNSADLSQLQNPFGATIASKNPELTYLFHKHRSTDYKTSQSLIDSSEETTYPPVHHSHQSTVCDFSIMQQQQQEQPLQVLPYDHMFEESNLKQQMSTPMDSSLLQHHINYPTLQYQNDVKQEHHEETPEMKSYPKTVERHLSGYSTRAGSEINENDKSYKTSIQSLQYNPIHLSESVSEKTSSSVVDNVTHILNSDRSMSIAGSQWSKDEQCGDIHYKSEINNQIVGDRYVILPGGMFAKPKDVYVESLPGGVGRQTGGCLAMSLHDMLIRYDALDKHYYRLKEENSHLRTLLFEFYQKVPAVHSPNLTQLGESLHLSKYSNDKSSNNYQESTHLISMNHVQEDTIQQGTSLVREILPVGKPVTYIHQDSMVSANSSGGHTKSETQSKKSTLENLLDTQQIQSSHQQKHDSQSGSQNKSIRRNSSGQSYSTGEDKFANVTSPVKAFIKNGSMKKNTMTTAQSKHTTAHTEQSRVSKLNIGGKR